MHSAIKEFEKVIRKHKLTYDEVIEFTKHARKNCKLQRPKRTGIVPKVPSNENLNKFFSAVSKGKNTTDILMFNILKYMGLRSIELVRIKVSDIDLSVNQPILFARRKAGYDKHLAIPDRLVDLISFYLEANPNNIYLFESRYHNPYTTSAIRKKCQKYSALAELDEPISPHDFRRWFCTRLASNSWTEDEIKTAMGNSSSNSIEHYVKRSPEVIRRKLNETLNII